MKNFNAAIVMVLPSITFIAFGFWSRFNASNQKLQKPFVVLKDEFKRGNLDGYWGFSHEVVVNFRRNSLWQDLMSSEKSAWYKGISEVVTSVETGRKFSPCMLMAMNPETYNDDIRKSKQEFWQDYDEKTLDKVHETLLVETTISWTEGWSSTIHRATLRHLLTPQQRHKVKTLLANTKSKVP